MAMDEAPRIKTEAEILRSLLQWDLIAETEIIAWADEQIAGLKLADDILVEIAMSSRWHSTEVHNLLKSIRGSMDRETYLTGLFSRLAARLTEEPRTLGRVASMLDQMSIYDDAFAGLPAEGQLIMVEDAVEAGWQDEEPVRQRLITLLEALSRDLTANPVCGW